MRVMSSVARGGFPARWRDVPLAGGLPSFLLTAGCMPAIRPRRTRAMFDKGALISHAERSDLLRSGATGVPEAAGGSPEHGWAGIKIRSPSFLGLVGGHKDQTRLRAEAAEALWAAARARRRTALLKEFCLVGFIAGKADEKDTF